MAFVRVAEKHRVTLAEVDEWPIDVILEEADIHGWLHDLDNPPQKSEPRPRRGVA